MKMTYNLEGHEGSIMSLTIWEGFLFSAAADWSIRVWTPTANCIRVFKMHTGGFL